MQCIFLPYGCGEQAFVCSRTHVAHLMQKAIFYYTKTMRITDNKYIFLLFFMVITLKMSVFAQSSDYFENRVEYFNKKFGKGNVFIKTNDMQAVLMFKDSLLSTKKQPLIAEHWKLIGKMYQNMGHMSSAESAFMAAIKSGKLGKDSVWVANAYSRLGSFYCTENRNFLALDCQLKALTLLEKHEKNRKYVPEIYNDIAKAYIQLGDLNTAEHFLKKSLQLKEERKDTMRLGIITTLYADIFRLKRDFAQAELFYLKDIPKREKQKNYEGLVISYHGLGDTYFDWEKYTQAEQIYIKALWAADTIKRYRTIGLSLVKLGAVYMKTQRYEAAEKVFNRAITECTQVDSRVYQLTAYYSMYELYKSKGNLQVALSFLEKYTQVNQLNTKESLQLKSEDMKAAYELKESEYEVKRLDAENRKNAQTQKVLLLGIFLLLLLSAFLVYLYFARNKVLQKLSLEQANTQKLLSEKEELLHNLEASHHQLVHSEKMASIGIMTAGIAHELNNPVSSIHASAEALKMDYEELMPLLEILVEIKNHKRETTFEKWETQLSSIEIADLSAEMKTLLDTIMNGSQRTAQIIQGLRTFTRDSGDMQQPYMITEGIDAALTLLHHKMKGQIEVEKNYHVEKPILCNVSKINQVFLNVLDNAIQAMTQAGKLRIETLEGENACIIRITDNGIGMDKATQNKIFEPFFTTKEIGKGTGLGLAISYAIIKEHNGTIEVVSELGKGTTFVISIPFSI